MLKIQTFGKKSYLPDLLIVHGLFGSGRNWRAIARNISFDRPVSYTHLTLPTNREV